MQSYLRIHILFRQFFTFLFLFLSILTMVSCRKTMSGSIINATLYLYGIDSLSTVVRASNGNNYKPPINYPAGNTLWDSAGAGHSLTLRRVITDWSDHSVTWNSALSATETAKIIVPPATKRWRNDAAIDITEMLTFWVANVSENFGCAISYQGALIPNQQLNLLDYGPFQQRLF